MIALGVALLALVGCASTPDGVNAERAAEANANLGADFLRKGENQEAESRFARALRYDSDNLTANWGMAVVHDRLGETAEAGRYYEKSIGLRRTGAILNGYATFLCQQDEVERAVEYFERAARDERYTGIAQALGNAGLCLHRAGQTEMAERYYRRALASDSNQFTALINMARLMYDRGDFLRARAFLERADAVSEIDSEQLLTGSRIELALGDREAAAAYLERYNAREPNATMSLRQLEQSR